MLAVKKKLLSKMKLNKTQNVCFISSTIFVSNISHSKKNLPRYDHKLILVSILSTCYACQTYMKLEFSRNFYKNIQAPVSQKYVQGKPSSPMWTDGQI